MRLFRRSIGPAVPALACGVAIALAAACGGDSTGPDTPPQAIDALPRALTASEQQVVSAGNGFSLALFRQSNAAGARDSNVFISPLSASMALGMTLNGAASTTFDAMRSTLGFGSSSADQIDEGYRGLIDLLRGLDKTTDFRIANSIWYRAGFPFEQSFLTTSTQYFDAAVQGLDFNNSAASLATINGWVDKSTSSKITKILDEIRPDHVMFLINAIYFKASWRSGFDPKETRDDQFRPLTGAAQPVKLMHQTNKLRYLETAQSQAVDLLYGNTAFAMTVLLPKTGSDVNALAASITTDSWAAWTAQFREQQVDLSLPKFTLEYSRTLNDDLKALGMGIAFQGGKADFTRMSSSRGKDLYIDFVKQKTFVDVYEEGTEAAAVTAVGVSVTSAPLTQVMRIDRPFVFAIRERFSGTILFMGKIVRIP